MEFVCICVKLIQDKNVVQELQDLIKQYELGKIDSLLNREVHQIGKRRRTNKELHLNAQIGEYDIDYVVLNLGSEVNVMTKKTWALMGKPKMIYSPIRLRMATQQAVSPFGRLEHVLVVITEISSANGYKNPASSNSYDVTHGPKLPQNHFQRVKNYTTSDKIKVRYDYTGVRAHAQNRNAGKHTCSRCTIVVAKSRTHIRTTYL
jgi:hypothetical protein